MSTDEQILSIASRLRAADATAERLGIEILEVGEGVATVSLVVGEADTNALGMGHGGLLFTLADVAMQYLSNGGGVDAVATGAEIDFVRPVAVGDTLTARGQAAVQTRRTAVWDVEVTKQSGEIVAVFRGRTRQIG